MALATNYRDLEIWKKSMDLCTYIYSITNSYPKNEQYGLTAQTRKSAVSIPPNIAEGFVRRSNIDFKRFLSYSHGSLTELETQVEVAKRLEYIKSENYYEICELSNHLGRMITKFHQSLKK